MKKNDKIISNIWEDEIQLVKRYRALRTSIKSIRKFTEINVGQKSADC